MNGNNPYAGSPGVVNAGRPTENVDLTPEQMRTLRRTVAGIVAQTQSYLPDSYAVGSELSNGSGGPQAVVAVHPPIGHAVSADFAPDSEDPEAGLSEADRLEVAQGLAASAAIQVMNAIGDGITPTAR